MKFALLFFLLLPLAAQETPAPPPAPVPGPPPAAQEDGVGGAVLG